MTTLVTITFKRDRTVVLNGGTYSNTLIGRVEKEYGYYALRIERLDLVWQTAGGRYRKLDELKKKTVKACKDNGVNIKPNPELAMNTVVIDDGGRAEWKNMSRSSEGRLGDCVPRAFAIHTGIEYSIGWERLRDLQGRTPDRGTSSRASSLYADELGLVEIWMPYKQKTAHGIAKLGINAILHVRRHMVACKGGRLYDTWNSARTRVDSMYVNGDEVEAIVAVLSKAGITTNSSETGTVWGEGVEY